MSTPSGKICWWGVVKLHGSSLGLLTPAQEKPRSLIFVKTPGEKLERPYPKKGHRGTRYYDGEGWGS